MSELGPHIATRCCDELESLRRERDAKVEALEEVVSVLGPDGSGCGECCDGCHAEMRMAFDAALAALNAAASPVPEGEAPLGFGKLSTEYERGYADGAAARVPSPEREALEDAEQSIDKAILIYEDEDLENSEIVERATGVLIQALKRTRLALAAASPVPEGEWEIDFDRLKEQAFTVEERDGLEVAATAYAKHNRGQRVKAGAIFTDGFAAGMDFSRAARAPSPDAWFAQVQRALDRADRAEAENVKLRAALRELVRLKELKTEPRTRKEDLEYGIEKGNAWQAARAAVSTEGSEEQ